MGLILATVLAPLDLARKKFERRPYMGALFKKSYGIITSGIGKVASVSATSDKSIAQFLPNVEYCLTYSPHTPSQSERSDPIKNRTPVRTLVRALNPHVYKAF